MSEINHWNWQQNAVLQHTDVVTPRIAAELRTIAEQLEALAGTCRKMAAENLG